MFSVKMEPQNPSWMKFAAFFCCMFFFAAAFAGGKVFFFVEDRERAEYDLDARVPEDALYFKGYDDTPYVDGLYYRFEMDYGSYFSLHTFYSDVGFGIKACGISYSLFRSDGPATSFGARFGADEGRLSSGSFDWRIGPNRIKGDLASHEIHIETGPLGVDVRLKAGVPFFRPGREGRMYFDDERSRAGQITHFPLFSAGGTIRDGSKVIEVKGWAYGNRLWTQGFVITDVTAFHSALRWHKEGLGFDLYDYITTDEFGAEWLPYLLVHHEGRIVHVSQNYTKEILDYHYEEKTGKKVPSAFRIKSRSKDSEAVIEFVDVKFSGYNDALIMFSGLMKRIVSIVSRPPIETRLDGSVRITLKTPAGEFTREGPGHALAQVSQ